LKGSVSLEHINKIVCFEVNGEIVEAMVVSQVDEHLLIVKQIILGNEITHTLSVDDIIDIK
jgi:hypothetical protein